MAERTLTLRELNRALLARQMLLEREALPVTAAVEKLVGMQAQIPRAPYMGLWTRLKDFRREDLAAAIADRRIVKATLMRGTLHFFTVEDFARHLATLRPLKARIADGIRQMRGVTIDLEEMLGAVQQFIAEQPRSFKEISDFLTARYPGVDVGAMRYPARLLIPLVQVPTDTRWSYPGSPRFALAAQWIDRPLNTEGDLRDLFMRYLAAFGPASVTDFQAWSGLTGVSAVIGEWRDELCVFRDEQRRTLYDLPDAPLPDADTPAPVRFVAELDNLLIGHDDRRRVIADEYRMPVMKVNGRGSITFLVDGFVRGVATIEKNKSGATLVIEPFEPIAPSDRDALAEEGEGLLRFTEPDAKAYAVRFAD